MKDSSGASVDGAVIVVQEPNGSFGKNVISSSRGEFWRLLLPGQYKVTAYHNGCSTGGVLLQSETVDVAVTEDSPLVVQDLVMDRVSPCENRHK